MRTKAILAATTLVLPLMLVACDRAEQSPTAADTSQEKERQAMTPSSPDRMLESSPPAAGKPPSTSEPSAGSPSSPSSPGNAPATP